MQSGARGLAEQHGWKYLERKIRMPSAADDATLDRTARIPRRLRMSFHDYPQTMTIPELSYKLHSPTPGNFCSRAKGKGHPSEDLGSRMGCADRKFVDIGINVSMNKKEMKNIPVQNINEIKLAVTQTDLTDMHPREIPSRIYMTRTGNAFHLFGSCSQSGNNQPMGEIPMFA